MLLEVAHLSKTFNQKKQNKKAVQDVSFALEQGKITAFLGPNGAGKTTTLKLILGLIIKDRGEISFDGQKIETNNLPLLTQTGALLEGTRNLYWSMSVAENFAYWGRYKGLSKSEALGRGLKLLKLFNLEDKKDTPVKKLSLGMQQTVSICCACLGNPRLLILDEPTLGLDVNAVEVMKAVLHKLAREAQVAILITTHEMKFAQEIADEVILIDQGKILFSDHLDEIMKKFNKQIVYQLAFDRVLNQQEVKDFQKLGKLYQKQTDYFMELNDVKQTPELMAILSRLPIIAINRKNRTLSDLFKAYVGD